MAVRYTPDELKFLRDSPLVSRPSGLPPIEQWMGPTADATRNSAKPANDRAKSNDSNLLLDQSRRPAAERHLSRNPANPEDIILGPPKTAFMSAGLMRNANKASDLPDRLPLRDAETIDRYNLRSKGRDGDVDRPRGEKTLSLRPKRGEGDRDQDSDGWSTVKPRKSFGTEGAERFNGRMGGVDRKFKDREERDVKDKPRGFDSFTRDIEHDQERDTRRNGTGRGRNESWFKDKEHVDSPPAQRERNGHGDRFVDRNRGWREKEHTDSRGGDRHERSERSDRGDRGDKKDRRWGNEGPENTPEWSLDAPVEEKAKTNQIKTAEDFQKWKEQMQGKDKVLATPAEENKHEESSFFGLEKQKVETTLEMNNGPDKFFGSWIGGKEGTTPDEPKLEAVPKAKTVGKASRFTSFFTPHEEPQRRVTEPPPPPSSAPLQGGLASFFGGNLGGGQPNPNSSNDQSEAAEKEAFQSLLQKLQHQTLSASGATPPADASRQPKPPALEKQRNELRSPPGAEPFQQYRAERPEEAHPSTRNPQQSLQQDILNQRQMTGSQPTFRPEQVLQELLGQRHSAMSQPSRPDLPPARNSNAEFLMGLVQGARAAPDTRPTEQTLLRMPPRTVDRMMQQQAMEREQEMQREAAQRERSSSHTQRQVRPVPPPGFMPFDEATAYRGPPQHERQQGNPPQPTQILQRPPPPGLDMGWDRQPQIPPQHRVAQNIAPPPGLANGPSNGPNRGMPMPQNMYPPGFPMGAFPPPDIMAGPPRNMQMQPPPGFFSPPPPGFMPPGMNGFQGPEGMSFGTPFDGRGPPPQGAFRR